MHLGLYIIGLEKIKIGFLFYQTIELCVCVYARRIIFYIELLPKYYELSLKFGYYKILPYVSENKFSNVGRIIFFSKSQSFAFGVKSVTVKEVWRSEDDAKNG